MALPYPDIDPNLITLPQVQLGGLSLGPFAIHWYALAYIAGILLGWRYAIGLVRNSRLWSAAGPPASQTQIDDLMLWITAGVIAGGRLGYVLFYMLPLASGRATLAGDPFEVVRLWHGGMSFHGGALGVGVALVLFSRRHAISLLGLADVIAACAPIGLCFGRLANFINGELWGRVTDVPWGMVFCSPHIPTWANGECVAGPLPRHPSQLYEAGLEGLVLFLVLRLATHRLGWLARPGGVTGLFLVAYGAIRIALENVRMPDEGLRSLPLGLTVGMMLSAPMVAAGLWLIWRSRRPGAVQTSRP